MNMKELEATVLEQGRQLQAAQEAHMHLVQRADNIVGGFKKELAGRDERILQMSMALDAARRELAGRDERLEYLLKTCEALHDGLGDAIGRIETLEKLVLARNASAATKRNMTDEDALRVLTGDLKDLSHKDAAEEAGLTYAQVYSCRLEFTFKHVHKTLRDGSTPEAPWKNTWVK